MNDAKELMLLEEALENGLSSIRERKVRIQVLVIWPKVLIGHRSKRWFNAICFLFFCFFCVHAWQMDFWKMAKKNVREDHQ